MKFNMISVKFDQKKQKKTKKNLNFGLLRLFRFFQKPKKNLRFFEAVFQPWFTRTADIPSQQRLRSSTTDSLSVPAVRLSTVGRRTFPVAGACI